MMMKDGARIHYKVIFSHGWPLPSTLKDELNLAFFKQSSQKAA